MQMPITHNAINLFDLVTIPIFSLRLIPKQGVKRMRLPRKRPFDIQVAAKTHEHDPLAALRYTVVGRVQYPVNDPILQTCRSTPACMMFLQSPQVAFPTFCTPGPFARRTRTPS